MAELYVENKKPLTLYRDRKYQGDQKERERNLSMSKTLYVGNLSFYTSEEQIFDVFSKVGEIKRIIMGLDRIRKTPCGFCFVEYFMRFDAEKSVQFLSGTKVDERQIRVDYDIGFSEGRQYGRGKSGGQVRDEHRVSYDPGRGGYGKAAYKAMTGMEMWGYNPAPNPAPQNFHPGRNMQNSSRFRGRGRPDRRRSFPGRFQQPIQNFPPGMFMPPQSVQRRTRSFHESFNSQPDQFSNKRARQDMGAPIQNGQSTTNDNGEEPMRNERLDRGRSNDEE